jgi:hypothetical protein
MPCVSSNDEYTPEPVEIRMDTFQRLGLVLLVLAIVFSAIGYFVSPLDEAGKPILLSPEVEQFETFRRAGLQWLDEYREMDRQMGIAMGNRGDDLFAQSREAQTLLQWAVRLAQDIDQAAYPPAAVSLHEDLRTTSLAYLETARKMMAWVGVPDGQRRAQLEGCMLLARQALGVLEKSKWLTNR